MKQFPDNFIWGAATAAYQIEGSPLADGAGASIWERFAHTKGMTANGDTGDIACDHYNRYQEDVGLMTELGLQSYRFSIAWGRVLPSGVGQINAAGLDFYDRLVDELCGNGITPMATLYHWDLPAALDDNGGWLNRDSADWFGEYARIMYEKLDDRVKFWCTLNEPWVVMDTGYLNGTLAPGHRNLYETPIVAHNLMRAHGRAVQVYREMGGENQIGLVVNLEPKYPATETQLAIEAVARSDAYMNRQFLDPAFLGSYPEELKEVYGAAWQDWPQEDFDLIKQPTDFLGVNYYTRSVLRHEENNEPVKVERVMQPSATYSETGWEDYPKGLSDILNWVKNRYGNPDVYITENGSAFYDAPVAHNGVVDDPLRVRYQQRHLRAVHQAIDEGCNVKGYYAWSLMDNLEWSLGFAKRFGIVHVNYATQERTIKNSGWHYRQVIVSNGANLFEK